MSQDEEIELKELVTEALEKNGVLAKIRAQLRANIFMTLENENDQKHQNSRLKDVLSTRDGLLTLLLVQELVEFCNLVQTASVFKAETGQGKIYSYEGRLNLLQGLKMSSSVNNDVPVLVHLIQMLFNVISKDKLRANSGNATNDSNIIDGSNERSFNESEGSPNPGVENNTFLVNSGRSDHYDLSFDSESSVHDDKNNLLLNINHSSESNDSLSTEIAGKISSKDSMESDVRSEESSIKPDSPDLSQNAVNVSSEEQVSKSNSSQKSNMNSYSKYLSDKHKSNKSKPDANDDAPPVDNIMKHFINSKLGDSGKSDQSISEEILKAYSDSVTWSEDSPRTGSNMSPPPRNILDDTLQESPSTKQRVNNQINSLKQQSLTSKDAATNITSKKINETNITSNLTKESVVKSDDIKSVKNDKNSILDRENPSKANWSPLADLPSLVVTKNTKILPCYNVGKTSSESDPTLVPAKVDIAPKKTSVIVENVNHSSDS